MIWFIFCEFFISNLCSFSALAKHSSYVISFREAVIFISKEGLWGLRFAFISGKYNRESWSFWLNVQSHVTQSEQWISSQFSHSDGDKVLFIYLNVNSGQFWDILGCAWVLFLFWRTAKPVGVWFIHMHRRAVSPGCHYNKELRHKYHVVHVLNEK